MLRELIEAGVDVFRLNFSHGTAEEHAENVDRIREAAEEAGREVGILGDLPGPKLRLGDLEGDVAVLHSASTVVLTGSADGPPGNAERLPVQWPGFSRAVKEVGPGLPRRRPDTAEGRSRSPTRTSPARSRRAARSAPTRG